MKVRTAPNGSETKEAFCTSCEQWKPATLDHFYFSNEGHDMRRRAGDKQAVLDAIARSYQHTSLLRTHCRDCVRDAQARRDLGRERNRGEAHGDDYPMTRYCPNGHGAHVFATQLERDLVGDVCGTCSAALTDTDPSKLNDTTQPIALPTLPDLRHDKLSFVVSALQAGRHVYLAGTPGTGKSELARQAAEALGLSFGMIACDSSMTRSTLMGLIDAGGVYHRTALRDAIEHGGVFLIDEMDNGNPSLLAALNSAMANGLVAFPDASVPVHADFRVIATANTWGNGPTAEFVGRLKVDPATLDRFVRLSIDIDLRLERELTVRAAGGNVAIAEAALEAVRYARKECETQGVKVLLSPRASMQVAALAAQGWSLKDAMLTTSIGTLDERRAAELLRGAVDGR